MLGFSPIGFLPLSHQAPTNFYFHLVGVSASARVGNLLFSTTAHTTLIGVNANARVGILSPPPTFLATLTSVTAYTNVGNLQFPAKNVNPPLTIIMY